MSFIDKKVSIARAIAILARNGLEVGEDEADTILDFLYLIAKNHSKPKEDPDGITQTRNRIKGKRH